MRLKSLNIILTLCVVIAGFIPSVAQRSVSDMLRPTLDSSQVSYVVIDTALTSASQNVQLPAQQASSNQLYTCTLDINRLVGDIPYVLSTSGTGQTVLTIPIASFTPEHEPDPGICLSYSSQYGMTFMGSGWTMTGTPVIAPVTRNFFTDGNATGKDRFNGPWTFDGIRLITQATTDTSQVYLTQTGNVKVLQMTGDNNGFVVIQPDGTRSLYNVSSNYGRYWYPSAMTVLNGQQVTYDYYDDGNLKLIKSIAYGDGRFLEFFYTDATDCRETYDSGIASTFRKKLSCIKVMRDSNVLRQYVMTYRDSRIDAPLVQLDQMDAEGSLVNPLQFHYYGDGSQHSTQSQTDRNLSASFSFADPEAYIAFRGRLDFATEEDAAIIYPNKVPYYIYNYHRVRNAYSGNEVIAANWGLGDGFSNPWDTIMVGEGFVDAFCMDVDGTHGEELVKVNQVTTADNQDHVSFDIYKVGLSGVVKTKTVHRYQSALKRSSHYSVWPSYYLKGDFTGDGREEVIMCRTANPLKGGESASFMMIDLDNDITRCSGGLDAFQVYIPGTQYDEGENRQRAKDSDRLFASDLDGDGKLEMCILHENGLDIYNFGYDIFGNVYPVKTRSTQLNLSDAHDYDVSVGDANGDGLSDIILLPNVAMRNVKAYLSKGDKTLDQRVVNVMSDDRTNLLCLDYNQDGTSDIIKYYKKDHIAVSTPDEYYGFNSIVFSVRNCSAVQEYLIPRTVPSIMVPVSLFGHSSNTHIISIKSGNLYDLHRCGDPKNMDALLTAVADSRGRVSQMEYRQLYQGEYYQPGFNLTFPYSVYSGGMFVCSAMTTVADGVTERDLTFSYHNATIHKQGLGFCGFQGITTYDHVRDQETCQTYDPTNFGVPVMSSSARETHSYGYLASVNADKRIQVLLKNDTVTDHATGVTATMAYTHDSYGNVLSATTTYPGGISKTETNEYHNVDSAGVWLIGLERRHTESVTRGGQCMTQGRTTGYTRSWLPDTIVTWFGSEQQPVSTCVIRYDSDKRPDRIRTRAYQGSWLTRHIGYSGTSRLPLYISDEQDIRTTCLYGDYGPTQSSLSPEIMEWFDDDDMPVIPIDGPIGRPGNADGLNDVGSGIVAPDPVTLPQLTTAYHYDSFGRQDSITAPDGSVKAVALSWAADVPGATYMSELTETGKPTARTWHDALGRKVRSAVQRYDGSWAYTLHEYDARGRLSRESTPTATGSSNSWTTYSYDAFDRLTEKRYPDGHSDLYSYDGLSTTSTIDGVTTTRTADALGNLVAVEDAGGTLQYALRPDGQPSQILAPGGIATTFDYDGYGRRTAIHDPSAGTRTTAYDANGRVASETDARGKSVASTYTAKGLLVTRTFDDGPTVTYGYNSWNQPTSMTGSDGHSKSWTYNSISQLATETVDGFTKSYTYDRNLVASVAYSKDNGYICTENYWHMNGHLTSVTLNTGDTLWTLRKQNTRLLPTRIGLGELNMSLSYDDRGQVTSRVVTGRDDEALQSLRYWYSAVTGNMSEREDLVRGTDEMFEYDNLNRLTDIELYSPSLGYRDRSTTYDGKGNILSQSLAGQYGYGTAKPYAFNELLSPSALIPQREQHISFNAMQQPDTISEGGYTAAFSYYGDMGRASMAVTDSLGHMVETRTYYDQQYNEFTRINGNTTQTKRILWLGGTPYNAPAALVKDYGESDWQLVHVLRDNLGSITQVVDTAGTVLQELNYSAWGLLRDPQTLEPYGPDAQPELLLGRGYTGHEHLPWFGLVNMNARLYDPAVGRFLSPDPLVQAPDNTQNYNRYSYCLNNPMKFIDKDGKIFWLVPVLIGAVVGSVISGATYAISAVFTGHWSWKSFGFSIAMGAVSGAISAGVGMAGAALIKSSQGLAKFGYEVASSFLSQSASYAAVNGLFGNDFQWTDFVAIAGSSLFGASMPGFKPFTKKSFINSLSELLYSSFRGGLSGFVQGSIYSAFGKKKNYAYEGFMAGAFSGFCSSLFMNLVFGAPYLPTNRPGNFGIYRKGGIASYIMGSKSITLGSSMCMGIDMENNDVIHEYAHVQQQMHLGWANFYAQILGEYLNYGFYKSYSVPGTLEYNARMYEIGLYSF